LDVPVYFINQIVDNLDIRNVMDAYLSRDGTSSYHLRMILKLVLYADLNNVYSCYKTEKKNIENIYYM